MVQRAVEGGDADREIVCAVLVQRGHECFGQFTQVRFIPVRQIALEQDYGLGPHQLPADIFSDRRRPGRHHAQLRHEFRRKGEAASSAGSME